MSLVNVGDLVQSIHALLQPASDEERAKVLQAVQVLVGAVRHESGARSVDLGPQAGHDLRKLQELRSSSFLRAGETTPKTFMMEKKPSTDVERVACLAYYLAHFRKQPYFKTLDITQLNTEAAQIRLGNPAMAVANAVRRGLLTTAGKAGKQLSALGEQYVNALPDREVVGELALGLPSRKRRRNPGSGVKL